MASSGRVVITGMGALCNIGSNLDEVWNNALKSKSNVSEIPERWRLFNDFRCNIWAPLADIDYAKNGVTKSHLMKADLVTIHQYISVKEALLHAGFTFSQGDSKRAYKINELADTQRVGVYMGTAVGGVNTAFNNHSKLLLGKNKKILNTSLDETQKRMLNFEDWKTPRKLTPFAIPMLMSNAVSAFIGIQFSLNGPNHTTDLACAAGASAILNACQAIQSGAIDLALTGGSEYLNDDYGASFKGFDVSGTLTQHSGDMKAANRPFDNKRSGFLLSEGGAGALVLESYEHAVARKATIYAEIVGYGNTFDAYSMMQPDPSGAQGQVAIEQALTMAGIKPADINYINAHGTGTLSGDEAESNLIARLFGNKPSVVSTKALTGHSIGASGAIEAIVCTKTLYHSETHGMPNLADPINDLNYAIEPQKINAIYGLTQSFAFGGHNITLVLKRWDDS
ncbi:beta-ketoacyl-[acyl-carrier-protein] synthase family protein [Agaribacter marinus]|uniref:3-oxoacyl-[acyl-carrier-protein] synthase 2 n=1 Tax=Agaribacter marinus TaxID=1431249 RepID=A0AA37T2B5_9ALTE|nr:beta-ketoacyl-[acyl-carrier-protein] synthase family protein [Agaribacter marinus]GLR72629.1 3-oxoacyl-[acyl-carrier-protein] synthase 2 [Agaribacter marinus]